MIAAALLLLGSSAAVQGDGIRLDFDGEMKSRVVATTGQETILGPFTDSETLLTQAGEAGHFVLQSERSDTVADALGEGRRTTLVGRSGSLVKEVEVTAYAGRPGWLFMRARYRNEGTEPLQVRGFTSHRYAFEPGAGRREPAFWSYQSASYESRPDWVLPIEPGYSRGNDLGMNDSDYGGGTPVVDVWRRDVGLAIGHVELLPKLVALPVAREKRGPATLALVMKRELDSRSRAGNGDDPELRGGTSRRLFRHAARLRRGDAGPGHSLAGGAEGCLRPDLVRLGLRPHIHAHAGIRDAAGRQAARLRLGSAG